MTGLPPANGDPPADTQAIAVEDRQPSLGTILFGGFLILIGLLWLLDRTEIVDLSWKVVLPGILVLVGLALIIASRSGSHDGLITIGAILTVVLTFTSLTDINLDLSVGDKNARPTTIEELEDEYALGIGDMTVDLTQLDFPPGETTVAASVGIGELLVLLPEGVAARIEWDAGVGEVKVLGDEKAEGVGRDGEHTTPDFETAEQRVILELSIGVGNIEVT